MKSKPLFSDETSADGLNLFRLALREDIGAADSGLGIDCTTAALVPSDLKGNASFVSRDFGIVCGLELCKLAIADVASELTLDVSISDGESVQPDETIATLTGSAHKILSIERTCLNFLGRLSGVSTLTHQYVQQIAGTKAQVFDTRKTTPGWRRLEKYAVTCGGGQNHRLGLYDAVMIKDNHLAFRRSVDEDTSSTIKHSIELARNWVSENKSRLPNGIDTTIELEVDTLEQLEFGLQTACDIILLDNMAPETLIQAVALRNRLNPKIQLEASGGVNLETIRSIAETGVERISVGAITHSAINFDIGLDWYINQ